MYDHVIWPERYDPKTSAMYALNDIDVKAPPDVVDGDETGSSAYHGWVITPTDDGCHVLTEETQQGAFFLEELGRKHPGGSLGPHTIGGDWREDRT
ncbi:MAG: hypothetical protein WAK94_17515 [Steroidobacteraceae bacterium]